MCVGQADQMNRLLCPAQNCSDFKRTNLKLYELKRVVQPSAVANLKAAKQQRRPARLCTDVTATIAANGLHCRSWDIHSWSRPVEMINKIVIMKLSKSTLGKSNPKTTAKL